MSFPRYESYKESGVEWLGEVPGDWRLSRLKQALSVIGSGGTPDTTNDAYWSDDGNGTHWVAIGDMTNLDTVFRTAKRLTECGVAEKGLRVWPVGTLLFSMYASLGHVAELAIPAATNQAILALLPTNEVNQSFMKRWLEFIQPFLIEQASSNTQDNLNAEKVKNLPFVIPSINEQHSVVAFLDRETGTIDALIAEQRRLIDLLKEKRQATISHAVTKGLDPDVPMKDSGVEWLGEVPEHWEIVPLKRAILLQRGHDLPAEDRTDGDIPVVSSAGISGSHDRCQAKGPGIVTGRYGTIGSFTFVESDYWPLNTTLYSAEMYSNIPRFLWYMLQNISVLFVMNSEKAAVPGVDRNDMHPVKIALAPHEEQHHIATWLDRETAKIDVLLSEAETAIALLQERRIALISAAVTGKIDVRGLVTHEPMEMAV